MTPKPKPVTKATVRKALADACFAKAKWRAGAHVYSRGFIVVVNDGTCSVMHVSDKTGDVDIIASLGRYADALSAHFGARIEGLRVRVTPLAAVPVARSIALEFITQRAEAAERERDEARALAGRLRSVMWAHVETIRAAHAGHGRDAEDLMRIVPEAWGRLGLRREP